MDEQRLDACPSCGGKEFITALNAFDVYLIAGGKPEFVRSEPAADEFKLFCRECGEEYMLADTA